MKVVNLSRVVARTKSHEKYINPVNEIKVAQNNNSSRQISRGASKKEIIVMNVYSRKSIHSPSKNNELEDSKDSAALKKDSIFESCLSRIETNQECMLGSGLGLSGFLDNHLDNSPGLKIAPCFPSEKSSPNSPKVSSKLNKNPRDSQA